jgi:tRNA(Ile)-lysidine synthase
MYSGFLENIGKKNLSSKEDKILLAVSGGRDSMAMIYLFQRAGFDIGVAHFNHKTRNGESDRDEEFVRKFCLDKGIRFFSTSDDIKARINHGEGNNFHDLARKYRYIWLEKIRKENSFDLIATAHNQDDNIETFLYRAAKGSGSFGLGGINEKTGNIIRPLLNFSRAEIDQYIYEYDIHFVEDSSNEKTDYDRNFIRHKIMPEFRQMHPDFDIRISKTIKNIDSGNDLMSFLLEKYLESGISKYKDTIKLAKNAISGYPKPEDLLYFTIFKYGFNHDQCRDIIKASSNTGKLFMSPDYILTIDRQHFNISSRSDPQEISLEITGPGIHTTEGGTLVIEELEESEKPDYHSNKKYFSADKVSFPLKLRNWSPGDRFCPFGLEGRSQKVKKYLTGIKISPDKRKEVVVLESNGSICAVLPYEIDHSMRVNEKCKRILSVEWKQ